MDVDMSGSVEVEELKNAFQILKHLNSSMIVDDLTASTIRKQNTIQKTSSMRSDLSSDSLDKQMIELMKKIDVDGNEEIEYSEFLAHTLSKK